MTKHLHLFVLLLAPLSLAGCSFREGIYVVLREDSFGTFKSQVVPLLLKKGFKHEESKLRELTAFRRSSDSSDDSLRPLYAGLQFDGERHTFFVGKGNTTLFSADEIAVMDDCAGFLAERAEMIVEGHATRGSMSSSARKKFYSKIPKL